MNKRVAASNENLIGYSRYIGEEVLVIAVVARGQ